MINVTLESMLIFAVGNKVFRVCLSGVARMDEIVHFDDKNESTRQDYYTKHLASRKEIGEGTSQSLF